MTTSRFYSFARVLVQEVGVAELVALEEDGSAILYRTEARSVDRQAAEAMIQAGQLVPSGAQVPGTPTNESPRKQAPKPQAPARSRTERRRITRGPLALAKRGRPPGSAGEAATV